jgi:transcription antitermination factor NusG
MSFTETGFGTQRAVACAKGPQEVMNVENSNDHEKQWFALRVKSRCEKVVAAVAQHKGFEQFLPLYRSRQRWSDRLKTVELPFFPGYVFCRLDLRSRLPLLTIPGALHFVGIGKVPVAIDDAEIAAIQAAAQSGLMTEPWRFIDVGQRVRLQEGPLAGLEGIFLGDSKEQRMILSITLLRRSIAVTVERHWAVPLDGSGQPVRTPVFAAPPLEPTGSGPVPAAP